MCGPTCGSSLRVRVSRDGECRGEIPGMEGRSHVLVGLAGGVVLDSLFHVTRPPLTLVASVSLALLVKKGVFYPMVAVRSILPHADTAHRPIASPLRWRLTDT